MIRYRPTTYKPIRTNNGPVRNRTKKKLNRTKKMLNQSGPRLNRIIQHGPGTQHGLWTFSLSSARPFRHGPASTSKSVSSHRRGPSPRPRPRPRSKSAYQERPCAPVVDCISSVIPYICAGDQKPSRCGTNMLPGAEERRSQNDTVSSPAQQHFTRTIVRPTPRQSERKFRKDIFANI